MKRKSQETGFALIELLIVTALAAVIGVTIYSTILNGVKIWERLDRDAPMEDANIFFEKIAHELRNSFQFKSIAFRGNETQMAFPIIAQIDLARGGRQEIGRVRYVFDHRKGVIVRGYQNYNQVVEETEVPARELMAGVQSVEFSYYVYDRKERRYLWVAEWQAEEGTLGLEEEEYLPVAVRIKVGVLDDARPEVLTRTISIPSGCCTEKGRGRDEAAVAL